MANCRECNQQTKLGNALCELCLNKLSGLDRFFSGNPLLLLLFSVFCSGLALLFAITGIIGCRNPSAKKSALVMLVVSGFLTFIGLMTVLNR